MENKVFKRLLIEKVISQMREIRKMEHEVGVRLKVVMDDNDIPWVVEHALSQTLDSYKDIKSKLWSVIGALTDYNMPIEEVEPEEAEGAKDE